MKNYKGAVFFDLDGTLLNNKTDQVPESAKKALKMLKKNGYLVCLSTGRDMDTGYSRKYLNEVEPDAVIHLNGSKITVGEHVLLKHEMDRKLLRKLIDYCIKNGFCTGTTIGDADYYTDPEQKRVSDSHWNRFLKRNFQPVEKLFEEDLPVICMSFASKDILDVKERVERDIPEVKLFPFNGNTGADVVEQGFSKAHGIQRICDHFNIEPENTYAFGDSPNDLPMFEIASVGVAMGNADEKVKEKADLITDPIDQDGIYQACIKLGLI